MPPTWLEVLAWAWLATSAACAAVIVVDIRVRGFRQRMAVMGWVWPITALYLGVAGLAAYWWAGRRTSPRYERAHGPVELPRWARTGVASTHCGGGCTLGDVVAEVLVFAFGISLFGATIWASFVLDYAFALLFGIAFQYAAISAMTKLSRRRTLARAAKADVLSLTAFEVGLFTWMALVFWVFFPDPHLDAGQATFWFLMQVGMAIGLATSYPMNVLLIRRGIKTAM